MTYKSIKGRLLLVLVVCFSILTSTIAFAEGVDDKCSTSSENKLASAIVEQIKGVDSNSPDDIEMLDDAFDVFSDLADSRNSEDITSLVSIEWTHGDATAKKYFTNTALEGDSADPNFKEAYTAVTKVFTEAGKKVDDKSKATKEVKGKINEISELANPKADIVAGKNILAPFMEPLNTITGLVVSLAIILLGLITAMDIFYLIIPIVKSKCDSAGQSGGKMSGTTKSGEPKFRLISDDAIMAYSAAQENGKHPVFVYLGMRAKTYIAAVIVIYLLLSGNLSVIFNVILTLLGGLIGALGDMFTKMGV